MLKREILLSAVILSAAVAANASFVNQSGPATPNTTANYSDTQGDAVASGSVNAARDIYSATVGNDATNLYFTINLNPAATLGTVTFNYGIGITSGPGANGDLASNTTTNGNAYKRDISIASSLGGMTNWIGLFPAGGAGTTASPWTSYGFNDYAWNATGSTWGTAVDTVSSGEPMATQNSQTGLSSISITVPMSDLSNLGLQAGSTFYFDIYSTGTSGGSNKTGQTAYDSLADSAATGPNGTANGYGSGFTQYDGTVLDSYTIQAVPEPTAAMALAGLGLLGIRRRK